MDTSSENRERICVVGPVDAVPDLYPLLDAHSWEYALFETPRGVLRQVRCSSAKDLVILTPNEHILPYSELCREIKFDARTAFVSVVFILSEAYARYRAEVFEAGADDCIQLPATPKEILLRLSNALRIKHATDSLEDSTAVLTSLAAAIEGRDAYTHGHVERVSTYAVEMGRRIGVSGDELATLKLGGIVHDIGKVSVPDQILNKPGKLDDVEMELIKRHPIVGYHILEPLRTFRHTLEIVRWHHERPNGKGYPDQLDGDRLPLLPRIVAVADYFDAISTSRPYRKALSPEECEEILSKAADQQDLDPAIVRVLLGILDEGSSAMVGAATPIGDRLDVLADSHPLIVE